MYAWSDGSTGESIDVSPAESTTYTVTGTSLGCSSTVDVVVTVNDLPEVDLGSDILLPIGLDTTLDATGVGLTYSWSTGATTPTVVINSAGLYTVTVTNEFGCSASDTIVVTLLTSVSNPDDLFTITTSPNPARDGIAIICLGGAINTLQLMDVQGKVLSSEQVMIPDGVPYRMNVSRLPSGIYFIRMIGVGNTETISFVKE